MPPWHMWPLSSSAYLTPVSRGKHKRICELRLTFRRLDGGTPRVDTIHGGQVIFTPAGLAGHSPSAAGGGVEVLGDLAAARGGAFAEGGFSSSPAKRWG